MSEESKVRSDLVAALAPLLAFPVENTAHVGCPDVCCLLGWIEIKLADRPVRTDTRVSVVVRPAQRLWMRNWGTQRGHCWWLTRLRGRGLDDLWTLHSGVDGANYLNRWNEKQMSQHALWRGHYVNRTPGDDLILALLKVTTRGAAL